MRPPPNSGSRIAAAASALADMAGRVSISEQHLPYGIELQPDDAQADGEIKSVRRDALPQGRITGRPGRLLRTGQFAEEPTVSFTHFLVKLVFAAP